MERQLDWILDDLVQRVAPVTKAVILSQDGIALGASRSLSRDDAEHLAALAAGFQSLAKGAGSHFGGGGVRQTIIEMDNAFLFVTAAATAPAWPSSPTAAPTSALWLTRWQSWSAEPASISGSACGHPRCKAGDSESCPTTSGG